MWDLRSAKAAHAFSASNRTIPSITSRRDSTFPRLGARMAGDHQDPSTVFRRISVAEVRKSRRHISFAKSDILEENPPENVESPPRGRCVAFRFGARREILSVNCPNVAARVSCFLRAARSQSQSIVTWCFVITKPVRSFYTKLVVLGKQSYGIFHRDLFSPDYPRGWYVAFRFGARREILSVNCPNVAARISCFLRAARSQSQSIVTW